MPMPVSVRVDPCLVVSQSTVLSAVYVMYYMDVPGWIEKSKGLRCRNAHCRPAVRFLIDERGLKENQTKNNSTAN
jgi:hypothetical protein